MTVLSGKSLSALAGVLILAAASAAVRVAVSAEFLGAKGPGEARGGADPLPAREYVREALEAERGGDVALALARYRMAAERNPALLDRGAPGYLGAAFEAKLNGWVTALRRGSLDARGRALEDASYLFRRVNGGCG